MNYDAPLGIVLGMPAEQYHAIPAVSNSAMSALARSPRHYWAEYLAPDRPARQATAAMQAGTLLHTLALEPHAMTSRYVVRPDGLDLRTKDGKAWRAAVPAGVDVIDQGQMRNAQAQRDAIHAVPELAALLASGQPEVSVFWIDEATGVHCKARADWLHRLPDGRVILLDLKTTSDASPDAFGRSVWNFGYHRQAAHYTAGFSSQLDTEVVAFVFGAVTHEYPHIAVPYMLADEDLARGHDDRRRLLELYTECRDTNHWPAYGAGMQIITRPAWVK